MLKLRASATPGWRLVALGVAIAGALLPLPKEGGAAAHAMSTGPSCGMPEGLPATLEPGLVRAEQPRGPAPAPAVPEAEPLEAPAVAMHAFFTCRGAAPQPQPVIQGWRASGPVRRS